MAAGHPSRRPGSHHCSPSAQDFKVFQGDGVCGPGYRLATYAEASGQRQAACGVLGEWYIARLAGGGSMDGPGYQCKTREEDDRQLGHSLCVLAEDPNPYFRKIAGQLAACFKKAGTIPNRFNEELECWTLTPDTGPGFSATLKLYTPQGDDLYAGDYEGQVQFQYGDARCFFNLSFDYSGGDITGTTSDFRCTRS